MILLPSPSLSIRSLCVYAGSLGIVLACSALASSVLPIAAAAGALVILLNPKLVGSKPKLVLAATYAPSGAAAMTITRSVAVSHRASSSRRSYH